MSEPEVRRTIPQLRALITLELDAIDGYAPLGGVGDAIQARVKTIRSLVEETRRRQPAYSRARAEHPDPEPAMIREIREYKAANPSVSYCDLAHMLNTSIRCVSFALNGRRDGRPVWDENGRKIARRGKAPVPMQAINEPGDAGYLAS